MNDHLETAGSSSDAVSFVGLGLYAPADAARLLGVPVDRMHRWSGDRKDSIPVIERRLKREGLLTFAELMELHFVRRFRDRGVSLKAVRKAAKRAASLFGTKYPLSSARFDTDGSSIFATLQRDAEEPGLVEDLARCQLVFPQIIRPFFKNLEYEKGRDEVARFWPAGRDGRIVLDPARRFGRPLDAETGVAVETLVTAFHKAYGGDAEGVAFEFDVPVAAVEAAVAFDRSLAS
ncbi:MAG: MerR family transcriptional regulator [Planctomycetota bacterium]